MPSGTTTSLSLADSIPVLIESARVVRDFTNVMKRLVDTRRLANGQGSTWNEIALNRLTAQGISESTDLRDNPQELVDTLFSIRPTMIGLSIKFTRKAQRVISANVAAETGVLGQRAIERKKDVDLLAAAAAATTDLGTAGNPLTYGLISAASSRVTGNTTEPYDGPKYLVAKSFQMKDLQDEIVAGLGTYPVPTGISQDVYRRGFTGTIANCEAYVDDNIPVDASDDAEAVVFGREAIVHVETEMPSAYTEFVPGYGGGTDVMYHYDEYGNGIRQQVWVYSITADAASPTN